VAERLSADVVVVGGGPSGLAAAVHAAEAGARTLLVDEARRPGGQIWRHRGEPPAAARPWLERLARSGASSLVGATVIDVASEHMLVVEHEGRSRGATFGCLVLATGARERFLPFPGWTLPGVVGVGGAQALLKSGARFTGLRVVLAGTGPLLPAVAAALRADGARVVGIVEQAQLERLAAFAVALARHPRKIAEGLGYAARLVGVPFRAGAWVRAAEGRGGAERVLVTDGRREWRWDCDVLACAFGLVPNLELPRLLGCATEGDRVVVDSLQQTTVPGVFAVGELCGIGGVDQAVATGTLAGLCAAGRPVPESLGRRRERDRAFSSALARAFALRDELKALAGPETAVCRCEDVEAGRLDPRWSARQAKLYSRAGMGPCQGRVCGPALAVLHGHEADTVRPPLKPVPLSTLENET
jgi:NADPH-dependent 2,4-dienoyl-CoA reductase/sulfur reductase-like enzyme